MKKWQQQSSPQDWRSSAPAGIPHPPKCKCNVKMAWLHIFIFYYFFSSSHIDQTNLLRDCAGILLLLLFLHICPAPFNNNQMQTALFNKKNFRTCYKILNTHLSNRVHWTFQEEGEFIVCSDQSSRVDWVPTLMYSCQMYTATGQSWRKPRLLTPATTTTL